MRIAHLADTHLGYRQYNLDEREQDIYDAFHQVIDKALEERVDVIVHSGDLFHKSLPPVKALISFKDALKKIDGKIKFLCVLGDHDIPKRKAIIPHELFDIHILGGNFNLESVVIDDVLFAGISNMKGKLVPILKKEVNKFDGLAEQYKSSVLILHQAIKKYLPFEGAYQLTLADLPKKASYYALGHIHTSQKMKFNKGQLVYAGSTEITAKDQINAWEKQGKGFYLVDIEGDQINHELIPLDIRPQVKLDLEASKLDDVLDYLDFEKKALLHLNIIGEDIDKISILERLEKMVKDKVIYHRLIFKDTASREVEIPRDSIDLLEIFKNHFENDNIAELAMDLYESLSGENSNTAIEIAEEYLGESDI